MSIKKLTILFIAAVVFAIIGYDVYAFVQGGTDATISWTMFTWSLKYPVFPFVMGFVMGHLFWQMKSTKKIKG